MVSFLSLNVLSLPSSQAPFVWNSFFLGLSLSLLVIQILVQKGVSREISPEHSLQRSSTYCHCSLSHSPGLWPLCHLFIYQIVIFICIYLLPLFLSFFQLDINSKKVTFILYTYIFHSLISDAQNSRSQKSLQD